MFLACCVEAAEQVHHTHRMKRPKRSPDNSPSRHAVITNSISAAAAYDPPRGLFPPSRRSSGIQRWLIVGALLFGPAMASAQPRAARDPDWPCQQIKVPEMSLASVWSGPVVDLADTSWSNDPIVADLVDKIAPRRELLDRAQTLIHTFAQDAGERKPSQLLKILAGAFNVLNRERDSVMAGLDRFGGRQKELAAQIRGDNEKLRALQTATTPDAKAIEEMTQRVKWEVELFQDRRQALTYACDVPGEVEQRLFALAHLIGQECQCSSQ